VAFGAEFRRLRRRAGLSREQLAERSGLSEQTILALELGRRRQPHPHTLTALAEALGLGHDDQQALLAWAAESSCASSPSAVPSAPPAARARRQLPVPVTPLVGRAAEVAQVRTLLEPGPAAVRLLTLVGPGGVGKTRLALAAAAELADAYADGVGFIDLAPLRDARLVPATIAHGLALREFGGLSAHERLLASLREQQVLLVLDNLEHLLVARALLAELLAGCPRLALLVTSRAVLRVNGERRFTVPPLATPANDRSLQAIAASPAVCLFVERAQAVASEFALEASTASDIAAICRRLDGLPLAIELAAARVGLLSPAELLRRLGARVGSHATDVDVSGSGTAGDPDDRRGDRRLGPLALLTGGAQDLPERQQTLLATLIWSCDLLGPVEQLLFRRLAVFVGGWILEAAEAVCGDAALPAEAVLDRLQVLVDSSLVHRLDHTGDERRFGMLETVREYALEQLEMVGEAEDLWQRHAAYFLVLGEQAERHLTRAEQAVWLDRLDRELENLRAALTWARSSGQLELGLRLAVALVRLWEERGHGQEGREWLESLLRQTPAADAPPHLAALRARALGTAAWMAFRQGDYRAAGPLAKQSLASWRQLGQVGNSPVALTTLAFVAGHEGDVPHQEALFRQSLALYRAEDDRGGAARVLIWLASVRYAADDLDAAEVMLAEGLAIFEEWGDTRGIALSLWNMGKAAVARRDYERAQALLERSLNVYAEVLDVGGGVAYVFGALAGLAACRGELEHARALCEDSVRRFRQLGEPRGLAGELGLLGRLAALQGDDAAAADAYSECLRLSQSLARVDLVFVLEEVAEVRARLAEHRAQPDQLERAARLFGAAAALRDRLGSAASRSWEIPLVPLNRERYEHQVAATRAMLGEEVFEVAWAEGRQLPVEQAIAEAHGAIPLGGGASDSAH
jgi:predicted ATPase/transcriptional regulator with XRE-family HTH domain